MSYSSKDKEFNSALTGFSASNKQGGFDNIVPFHIYKEVQSYVKRAGEQAVETYMSSPDRNAKDQAPTFGYGTPVFDSNNEVNKSNEVDSKNLSI